MEICPGDYIKELLLEHKSVSLPNIGGFLAQTQSAQLDVGLGKLSPPSKKIIFTPNLAVNDGLLVNYMMGKFDFSLEKATEVLLDYCQDINHSLNNKEFFSIMGIGRIYKDFEGKIKFLPDHSNLNADAFGLPDVDFSPMAQESTAVRQKPMLDDDPAIPVPITAAAATDTMSERGASWWSARGKLVTAIAALLLIIFTGFLIFKKEPKTNDITLSIPDERTNISPVETNDMTDEATNEEEVLSPEEEEAVPVVDTEEATIAPDQKVAIIAIGKFGNKENVKKLVTRIFDEGFDPYQENLGKLTRVGIQFTYENESEVDEILKQVRKIFEPDAEILQK